MALNVLKTKLTIPPGQAGWISRPRLIRQLDSGKDCRLVVVSAPAGFGKTTMLSEWASSRRGFAWLSLDQGDNDPLRFWTHFISSLRMVQPDLGEAALELLQSYSPSSQLPAETFLTTLINELFDESASFTMILDDYHLISNRSIHDDLRFLIDRMPSGLRLVVSSRVKPPLSLGRLKIRGQLLMLTADDLRFTPQEIALFARRAARNRPGEEDISALERYSEGWAAGLQIAAMALKKGASPGGPLVSRGYEQVVDYFLEEILSSHPGEVRSFLLDTSILSRLNGPLCDAVTGRNDSAHMLNALYEGNTLIVALDHQRREYRFHCLFVETLKRRLDEIDPERARLLHSRAARWLVENGLPDEAIRHAIEARDWDYAAALVSRHAAIALSRGEASTALSWMQSLPAWCFASHAGLCTGYAWALFLSHLRNRTGMPFETIERLLNDAQKAYLEKNYGASKVSEEDRRTLAHANALRVHLAYERGEPAQKIVELCNRSLTGADGDYPIERAGIYTILGMAHMSTGRLEPAAAAFDEARSIGFVEGISFVLVAVDCLRTLLTKLRGRLRESEAMCRESMQIITDTFISRGKLLPEMLGLIRLVMASIHLEKGRLREAGAILDEVGSTARMLDYSFIAYNALLSRLRLGQGAGLKDVVAPLAEIGLMERSCPGARGYSAALNIRSVLKYQGHRLSAVESAFRMAESHSLSFNDAEANSAYPFTKYWHYTEQLSLARLHLAEAALKPAGMRRLAAGELVRRLEDLIHRIGAEGWGELEIEGLILLAEARQAERDQPGALECLERALSLAEPQGYELMFIEEGAALKGLLQHAVDQGVNPGFSSRILEEILRASGRGRDSSASTRDLFNGRIEPLSRQELAVLKLIANGLSNQEIADELCVALTTVKAHNYSIFSKLNVRKRFQAVKKARELDLL